ncbi:hypothetical protein BGZ76_002205, partial [Entomortierella beljakovae]
KSDIADAMALLGVFAPFLMTERMRNIFTDEVLGQLVVQFILPEPLIDDAAVLKAIRHIINGMHDDASEAMRSLDHSGLSVIPAFEGIEEMDLQSDLYKEASRKLISDPTSVSQLANRVEFGHYLQISNSHG